MKYDRNSIMKHEQKKCRVKIFVVRSGYLMMKALLPKRSDLTPKAAFWPVFCFGENPPLDSPAHLSSSKMKLDDGKASRGFLPKQEGL